MAHIKISKPWEIRESEATPEWAFLNRRRFLAGTLLASAATAGLVSGCTGSTGEGPPPSEIEKKIHPAPRNPAFTLDRDLTDEAVAAGYNNFYEFSGEKEDVKTLARRLVRRPWSVEVSGLVGKPRTFDIDDLLKALPVEERLYRHRCVEAWAMAVPWTGFPLSALLNLVEPLSAASHVRMTTFHRPFQAFGQLAFWEPWPYTEGLTMQEAMNELAFLAVGIYGHPLPPQHGAPIRLVVPWKYGYKSIKSVVKIELLDREPATFWNTVDPLEYDFTANVDPKVPHPRWSQAREKMIGTGQVRLTLPFNGYGPEVAHLYPRR